VLAAVSRHLCPLLKILADLKSNPAAKVHKAIPKKRRNVKVNIQN
jgi:hypothetical protein